MHLALDLGDVGLVDLVRGVSEVLGEKSYPKLSDVPFSVEVVLVFRPSADAPAIAKDAVAIGAKALWLQQGIVSPQGRRMAEAAGIDYTEDQCTAVVRAAYGLTRRAA